MIAILRPLPQSQRDRDWLLAAGVAACALPMLQIKPSCDGGDEQLIASIIQADILIFTSQQAIHLLLEHLTDRQILASKKVICVGPASRIAAQDAGLEIADIGHSSFRNAAEMAEQIKQHFQNISPHFLWLSAAEVQTDIAELLLASGLNCERFILYRAEPVLQLDRTIYPYIENQHITGIVCLSRRTLIQFQTLLIRNDLWHLHHDMHLFVSSEHVLEGLNTSFKTVTICKVHAEDGYLHQLLSACRMMKIAAIEDKIK